VFLTIFVARDLDFRPQNKWVSRTYGGTVLCLWWS